MENRRTFLKALTVLPLTASLPKEPLSKAGHDVSTSLNVIGQVRLKKPKEIKKSPFGIGCETLDRALWDPKEVYPWMDNLPVKWARLQTGWTRVERQKGTYDWQWLDESVDGLIERGFQPFFNVGYGNTHYTEGDMGYHPLVSEQALQAWKKFVVALATRYRNKIKYFEIWNEPNLTGFWKPGQIDPQKYVQLVRETAPLIRKHCPGAKIVGGVVSRLPFTFIKALFEAGLGKEIDVFSFHPYNTLPESYTERIVALRRLVHQYNPAIQIWQGENGFASQPNTTGFSGEGPWTENIQAKIMLRRLLIDCSLDLPMTLWFLIVDLHDYPKGTGKVNYKGILRTKPEIAPKVAFKALQNLGSLIHGEVRTTNSLIHVLEGTQPAGETEYNQFGNGLRQSLANVQSTTLHTDNGPVLAYWCTEKAADAPLNRQVHLFLWDWEGSGFKEPVLVDPLTGTVAEVPHHERFYDNDKYRVSQEAQLFRQVPLQDYPLLIMEKSQVL